MKWHISSTAGFFVDSGMYPERNGDGIVRKIDGGIGAGTLFKRAKDYMAPVTAHYGYNNVEQYDKNAVKDPASLIGGCTFEKPEKIVYIDELDEEDNVNLRMDAVAEFPRLLKQNPSRMKWLADGIVMLTMFFPVE